MEQTSNLQYLADAGAEAAIAFFNGDSLLLESYQVDLVNCHPDRRFAPAFALESAAYCLSSLLAQMSEKVGYQPSAALPSIAQLHYLKEARPDDFYGEQGLSLLIKTATDLKRKHPTASAQKTAPAAKAEKPVVQKFEIVSMPDRVTDVTVERNQETQEIVKTTHVERDA